MHLMLASYLPVLQAAQAQCYTKAEVDKLEPYRVTAVVTNPDANSTEPKQQPPGVDARLTGEVETCRSVNLHIQVHHLHCNLERALFNYYFGFCSNAGATKICERESNWDCVKLHIIV